MTRTRLTSLVASGLLVLAAAHEAPAQYPGSLAPGYAPNQSGPTFSPYLNLLRRDSSPAINYYGLVRPEQQFRSTMQNLANELEQTQADVAGGAGQPQTLTQTGHPIQFFNLSHYYPNSLQGAQGRTAGTGATGYQTGMQNTGAQNLGGQTTGGAGAASRGTPSMPGR